MSCKWIPIVRYVVGNIDCMVRLLEIESNLSFLSQFSSIPPTILLSLLSLVSAYFLMMLQVSREDKKLEVKRATQESSQGN